MKQTRRLFALFDLLGRRWAMRIIWELGSSRLSSRALAARCGGVSPTVLHRRLDELRGAHLVELEERRGYSLTRGGLGLRDALQALEHWSRHPQEHAPK